MKWLLFLTVMAMFTSKSFAKVQTRDVDYKDGKVELQGYLAYDDSTTAKRPGVLIFHEWKGPSSYERSRAEQLAQMGYVAFVADVYGKGMRLTNMDEYRAESTKYKSDRPLTRERARAALDTLRQQPMVDPQRIAAIGFCIGGMVALELARSGADVAGVVTFHGALDSPKPEDARNIKGMVLVLHGADDPTMKPEVITAFQDEMRNAGVDWQFVSYGGAVHSFSNPASGSDKSKGAAYDEKAARRSWEAMAVFFKEIFGS